MSSKEEIEDKLNLLINLWEDKKTRENELNEIVILEDPGSSDARALSAFHQAKINKTNATQKLDETSEKLMRIYQELVNTCAKKNGGKINALKKQTRSRGKSMKRGKSVKMRQT